LAALKLALARVSTGPSRMSAIVEQFSGRAKKQTSRRCAEYRSKTVSRFVFRAT
jgi:hypothetical protein